ncbi:MAG: S-layer homology domain-containing protein, partial [Peptoniphilus sp.]|nr:S-layer homology domain-containing protein [Peptoniphilus sp.]
MNKKILSLVLALVMVLGAFTTVFAEEAKEEVKKVVGKDQKIQYLIDKKFVEGDDKGDFGYDKNIKRSEITKLLVYANGNKALAEKLQGSMQLYSDVDHAHWANGVISVGSTVPSEANGQPMLNGYPDGSFKPENDVTYAELAKMLVVLVKKDLTADMVKQANANWAAQWMTWAAQLGILEDVVVTNSGAAATRADAFVMVYNALYAMKYVKNYAANDTLGIISQFKNNELTLNQGEKAKAVKLDANTVFVLYSNEDGLDANAHNAGRTPFTNVYSKAVKVHSISNPSYYYGSLVRVITDGEGVATHILELGNPAKLALGNRDKTPNKQDLFAGQWDPSFPSNAASELGAIIRGAFSKISKDEIKWSALSSSLELDKYIDGIIKDWSYTGQGWWKVDPNTRWQDIADATAETKLLDLQPAYSFVQALDLGQLLKELGERYEIAELTAPQTQAIINIIYDAARAEDIVNATGGNWDAFLDRVYKEIVGVEEIPNREELAKLVIGALDSARVNFRYPTALGILAKIDYSNGSAKAIEFWGGVFTGAANQKKADANNKQLWDYVGLEGWLPGQELIRARLTSSTKYFVADVANNQMTEVSLDEALRILGNTRASNWFSDVYVGYDNFGDDEAWQNTNPSTAYKEATVVVFNSVQKGNNNGGLYRVTNQATTRYEATLENTHGEKTIINIGDTRFSYPFDFNDSQLDVVEYYNNAAYGQRFITMIDHSKTSKYPIVNVYDVDGRKILVRDEFGNTAKLTLDTDYDQFLVGQRLLGANIQFRTTTNNDGKSNVVEIVSILDQNWNGTALRGSLQGVVGYNEARRMTGVVKAVESDTQFGNMRVRIVTDETIYDDSNRTVDFFKVTREEAAALKVNARYRFMVEKDYDSTWRAYDFELVG